MPAGAPAIGWVVGAAPRGTPIVWSLSTARCTLVTWTSIHSMTISIVHSY
jgi:hypothetical protein